MDDRTNLQEFDDETDPQNPDSDEDGSNDGNEAAVNTDPLKKDTDGDGIEDGPESNSGTYVDATDTGTDPLSPDSDLDGRFDLQEIMDATDPTDASSPSSTVVGFGVNFVSETGEGMPIPATEIAGLREFAIKNWNNTVAGSITGDISLIDGAVLRDADGNDLGASAGTTLTWEADTIWQISNQYPGQGATLGGDSKLFTGYIDNTGTIGLTIDVNDIPYPAYDVIVYLASDGNDRTGEISIQDAADMELGRYDFTTNASQAPFELSDYVVTESTDLSYPSSQVAIFRGISGSHRDLKRHNFSPSHSKILPSGDDPTSPPSACYIPIQDLLSPQGRLPQAACATRPVATRNFTNHQDLFPSQIHSRPADLHESRC
ncbi:hypothetical protein N9259_01845 [bacterium]|nr:hypothetical protein [bacterium]